MNKAKTILGLALAALFLLGLTACGDKVESYAGEFTTPYEINADGFTINVKGESKRYVVCSVTLELADAKLAETFAARGYRLNEIVIETVQAYTLDELRDDGILATMRQTIVERINEEFTTTGVSRAVFSKWYIA